jgi:hypothetical protein
MIEKKEETKRCKNCDKEISEKAKKCPFCQTDLRGVFRRHPILTFLGIIFLLPMLLTSMLLSNRGGQSGTSSTPVPERTFNASVNFTGSQFVIGNLDTADCQNARLQINGGTYSLDGYILEKGQIYKVGAMQFTKKDGTRFNPLSTKPNSFFIYCKGSNELNGVGWYGEFK